MKLAASARHGMRRIDGRSHLQIGVLSTGYFVLVDIGIATLHRGCALERSVEQACLFPECRVFVHSVHVDTRVVLCVLQCSDETAHGGLRGHSTHGVNSDIDDVRTGFECGNVIRHTRASGVTRQRENVTFRRVRRRL